MKKILDTIIEDIEKQSAQTDAENKILQREIDEIKDRIETERDPNKESVIFDIVDNQPQRMQRIMRRNRVISKIKASILRLTFWSIECEIVYLYPWDLYLLIDEEPTGFSLWKLPDLKKKT